MPDFPVNEFGEGVFNLPRGGWIAFPPKDSMNSADDQAFVTVEADSEIAALMGERVHAFKNRDGDRARAIERLVRDLWRDQRTGLNPLR
jgi:hypothetical protein